jgi:hypothetical protein
MPPISPDVQTVMGIAKRLDKEIAEHPLNTQVMIANILLQCVQYRTTQEVEAAQKEQERVAAEQKFSPHKIERPS